MHFTMCCTTSHLAGWVSVLASQNIDDRDGFPNIFMLKRCTTLPTDYSWTISSVKRWTSYDGQIHNTNNITERFMGHWANTHFELYDVYSTFFLDHII